MADIDQQARERIFQENFTHHVYRGSCVSLPCYCWATDDHVIGDEVKRYADQPTTLATAKPPTDLRTKVPAVAEIREDV